MCGGRGTRLDSEAEKPLFEIGGRPMVARVADALEASRVESVHAVVSPNAPETREFAQARDSLATIETPGEGYVADLQVALDAVESPVLTTAADLPLLEADAVNLLLDAHDAVSADAAGGVAPSTTVCVPAALKRALGASVDTAFEREEDGRELAPTGVNVVAESEEDTMYETYDARLAVNVNRRSDAKLAEELL
ncbi:NTP transferase domain-containing protein [Halorussus ruber]|uniref:NTP transferase domain-containing protein n=1 Tax=Halorussus ruber TaxID=1126238 RepID=UPI00109305C6|nr:NTP transferase domain-containing protein [Halorussus ruber]